MKIRTGEKGYGGIVFVVVTGLLVGIILREKGFVIAGKNGEEKEGSKLYSAFVVFLNLIPVAGFGLMLRGMLKTNNFICKYCKKEFGESFETEKEVCRDCYEKKKKTAIKEHW